MKILVCGDRKWTDRDMIRQVLSAYKGRDVTIIEGGAQGADIIACDVARELGLNYLEVPADWNTYGRAAGPIRNRKMLDLRPDLVLAFHDDPEHSKGTKDTITEAKRRKIRVINHTHKNARLDKFV